MSIGELIEQKTNDIAEDHAKLHSEIMAIKVAGAAHIQNEIYNQTGRNLKTDFAAHCADVAFDQVTKMLMATPLENGKTLGDFEVRPKIALELFKRFDVQGRVLAYLDDISDQEARERAAQVKASKAGYRETSQQKERREIDAMTPGEWKR